MGTGATPPLAETELGWHSDLDDYIERAPTPIYVWQRANGDFRLVALNRAARVLSGERAEALLGATPTAVGDGGSDLADDLARCLDAKIEISREYTPHSFGDGRTRTVVVSCVAVPPDRVLVHATDVSEQRAAEERLRASEERYRTLIQAANEGVWLVDGRGRTVFANQRVTRLLGYPADDILTGNIADFADPADRARLEHAVAAPGEVAHPFVATFCHRSGRTLTFLVSVAPVGALGDSPATLCVLADMTALRREQDLRLEAERRYRRIVETANEGVWTVDPNGVTTLVNQRMAEMLGVAPEEMVGHPFWDFAGDPTAINVVQRALALDGRPIRGEVSMLRKDGTRVHVLISLSSLRDERGELLGGLALVSDITAIKQGHEELRESQERFAQVFEEAPVGIAFIAAGHLRRGRFLETNANFRELLGYSDDELRSLDNVTVTHPDDREQEQELMAQLFDRKRDTYELDKRYLRSDDSVVWAHVRVALVRDEKGVPLYLIAVAADITAAKEAEALAERAARTTGTILEHTSDAVIEVAVDGTVTEFSPSAVRMFGYERDEAIGRDLADLTMPAALRGRYREAIARYLASGATRVLGHRYQTTAMRADGTEFPVEVTIDAVADSDPPEFIGSVRSLAGEHALVAARQEADERFERAFRDGATGMALVGLDERFVDVNAALCEMTGRSATELIGKSWRDVVAADEAAAVLAWQGRALAGATEPFRATQRIMRSDGRSVRALLVASLVRRGGKVPMHYVHQYTPHSLVERKRAGNGSGEPLAYRERQVLTLLARGLDGPAIAAELGLSPETVRSYTQSAREKLGAATRTQAVALALAHGEISL